MATLDQRLRLGTQHPTTSLQRRMEGPHVRSGGRTPPPTRRLAQREQVVQPSLAPTTQPRPKTTTERRNGYISRPTLEGESLAPNAYRDGFRRNYHRSLSGLVPTRASGATRYNRQSALSSDNITRSLPAWLYPRRGAVIATLVFFTGLHREPRIPHHEYGRQTQPKHKITVTTTANPWIETMKPYMTRILGFDALGASTLGLLSASWAPSKAETYGSSIRRYFDFCEEHQLAPLVATPAHMAR
jgi:hypothetical protein